jgi:acyl carrier protein
MTARVEDTVIAILSRAADRPAQAVTPGAALSSLGFGSLEQIECMLALEDALEVEISETDARAMRTVQDVIDAAQRAIAGRPGSQAR